MTWLNLTIFGLACYRLAVLLSDDVGPYGMFAKLRSFLKREARHNESLRRSKVHLGIQCLKCDSVWVAAPVAAYAYYHDLAERLLPWFATIGDVFLLAMALSTVAILLNRMPKAKNPNNVNG